MLRALSLLGLLLAAAVLYLSGPGRSTTLGTHVVEIESMIHTPLAPILGFAGLIGLLVSLQSGGPRRTRRQQGLTTTTRRAAVRPVDSLPSDDWRAAVFDRAARLDFGPGVSLDLRSGQRSPFRLKIADVSPERVRRAASLLAALLAEHPLPRRVDVSFVGFRATGTPRKALVISGFVQSFARTAVTATEEGETVVVRFQTPDPRWDPT